MKFKLLNRANDNGIMELRLWEKLDGGKGKEVGQGGGAGGGSTVVRYC